VKKDVRQSLAVSLGDSADKKALESKITKIAPAMAMHILMKLLLLNAIESSSIVSLGEIGFFKLSGSILSVIRDFFE
jgi:hypothetical protein